MQVLNISFHIFGPDTFRSTLVLATAWMIVISIAQARCGVSEHLYHSELFWDVCSFNSTVPLSLFGKNIRHKSSLNLPDISTHYIQVEYQSNIPHTDHQTHLQLHSKVFVGLLLQRLQAVSVSLL
jgi:hypothetical protein